MRTSSSKSLPEYLINSHAFGELQDILKLFHGEFVLSKDEISKAFEGDVFPDLSKFNAALDIIRDIMKNLDQCNEKHGDDSRL